MGLYKAESFSRTCIILKEVVQSVFKSIDAGPTTGLSQFLLL